MFEIIIQLGFILSLNEFGRTLSRGSEWDVRDRSFASVRELIEAIDESLAVWTPELKRYVSRATGKNSCARSRQHGQHLINSLSIY
jgi:hypothetical protein